MAEVEIDNAAHSPPRADACPEARAVERDATAAIINGGGLCSTCNNAGSCFYRASRGPALFCELFDDHTPPVLQASCEEAAPLADSSRGLRVAEEEALMYSGLCVNCEHRRTCTHPKPAGGVWHCEHYE